MLTILTYRTLLYQRQSIGHKYVGKFSYKLNFSLNILTTGEGPKTKSGVTIQLAYASSRLEGKAMQ